MMDELTRHHLRFGWVSLCVFAALGIALETLHGLKVGWYLEVAVGTRRLMWTLAHAHGTLLGLVHIAFATSVSFLRPESRARTLASRTLMAASILLPAGFFVGGINIYDGDPGLGILLVPAGAASLLVALVSTVLSLRKS